MTRSEAVEFILGTNGLIFAVEFIRRGDGQLRYMKARTGVNKYLTGAGPRYDFAEKGLISVFDMDKGWYRSIPKEGIVRLMIDSKWYDVVDNPIVVS